jgi:hypothetical protein
MTGAATPERSLITRQARQNLTPAALVVRFVGSRRTAVKMQGHIRQHGGRILRPYDRLDTDKAIKNPEITFALIRQFGRAHGPRCPLVKKLVWIKW